MPFKSSGTAEQCRIETSLGAEFLNRCRSRTQSLKLTPEIIEIFFGVKERVHRGAELVTDVGRENR